MTQRPEYMKCIGVGPGASPFRKVACGQDPGGGFFVSLEHALATVATGGRLVPCPACIAAFNQTTGASMNPLDPQPDPKAATGDLWADLILALPDILRPYARERREQGIARYGTPLQVGNGRDPLFDAFQEEMDRIVYLYQYNRRCHAACHEGAHPPTAEQQRALIWSAQRVSRAVEDAAETAAEIARVRR